MLDRNFDGDGVFQETFGLSAVASAVAVDPTGRIVAGGTITERLQTQPFSIVNQDMVALRLSGNGAFDSTFDTDGWQTVGFFPASSDGHMRASADAANGLALQAGGAIVLAGSTYGGVGGSPAEHFALARLTASGQLDPSFDGTRRICQGRRSSPA